MNIACNRHDDNLPILFVDFNQNFSSIQVGTKSGYSLLSTLGDQITETFSSVGDPMCIVGRLFNRSLITLVSQTDMRRLLVAHSRINTLICHYRYTLTILAVKMNHQRLVVCVEDGIFIHNMRDMQLLHKVEETPPNRNGVIALSSDENNCYLAYPGSHRVGTVFIFDAMNFQNVTSIAAHDGLLAALSFNSRANLLATASEKGTVIRVFSIPQGDKIIEFRRGLTRCVSICSLTFSVNSQYLVAASHTETIHVFKLESHSSEKNPEGLMDYHHYDLRRQRTTSTGSGTSQSGCAGNAGAGGVDDSELSSKDDLNQGPETNISSPITTGAGTAAAVVSWSQGLMGWMGNTLKNYSAYLPHQVSEIFAQDRAFAYARIPSAYYATTNSGNMFRPAGRGSPNATIGTGVSVSGGPSGSPSSGAGDVLSPCMSSAQSISQPAIELRKVAALVYYQNQPRLIVAGLDGLVHIFSIDPVNGGEAVLLRTQRLLSPTQTANCSSTVVSGTLSGPSYESGPETLSKHMPSMGSGGPQQPGVYALPASACLPGKSATFASVVAGSTQKNEEDNSSQFQ